MHSEQLEIAGFLSQYPPFDSLPENALNRLALEVEVSYFRAHSDILKLSETINDLYVIRKGAVETYRRTGELYNRLSDGELFGQMSLMMNRRVRFPVKAIEDTLIYCIPHTLFEQYCDEYEIFADYFESEDRSLLQKTLAASEHNDHLSSVKLCELLQRPLVTVTAQTSIRETAQLMTEHQLSSMLIVDQSEQGDEETVIDGIITDWDLRERVVSAGVSTDQPVSQAMSRIEVTLDDQAYVSEAIHVMLRHNIHHLPILHQQTPIGVLALTELVQYESQSSILVVRSIFNQNSIQELQQHANQTVPVFQRLVKEDANSHMIGSALSVIGRGYKQRLLELAEQQLGPPPVPYCLLALGSMARDEQLIYTDQDNALVLDDRYDPDQHEAYFEQLATFLCDGLDACGYRYCSGMIMATNPQWRLTRSQWKQHFSVWIDKPDPQALLNSSIFFDLDGVYGKTQWAQELKRFIVSKTRNNRAFLASMARNALSRTPPLGFFKDFVMEKDGQHKDSINLKRRGSAPLTDLVRVHALAIGSLAVNSFERLDDIIASGILPDNKGAELKDALEYISIIRIRNMVNQIEQGQQPDNNIRPQQLGSFERRNLKEAFQVLSHAQGFIKYRYNSNIPLK